MAKSMIDSNSNIEELRDSLENNVEEHDRLSVSTTQTMESRECAEDHSSTMLPNNLAKVSSIIEKEHKASASVEKHVMKPKAKNMIEWNKMNIVKGQPKNSYCKLHQKKAGKTALMQEKKKETIVCEETNNPSKAAIEFHKQLVLDGILTKDEWNNFDKHENMSFYFCNKPEEKTNYLWGLDTSETNEHRLESTTFHLGKQCFLEPSSHLYLKGMNPNDNFKYNQNMHGSSSHYHGAVSPFQLPPVRTLSTSVQSAPADMHAHQDQYHEKSYRSSSLNALKPSETYADLTNSMTSLTSSKFASEHGYAMTYSSIYANAKQSERTNYKPYTLGDYKRLKKDSKPGGLGPNTKSEEYQQKAIKAIRQKEYSVAVKQRNTSVAEDHYSKKKCPSTSKEMSVQKQEANNRRMKALEYAKAIPKPVASKHQNAWRSPTKTVEEPQTLLEILQLRHESEKKAVDAMRRDLQAKLKTR